MEYLNVPVGHRPPVENLTLRKIDGNDVLVSEQPGWPGRAIATSGEIEVFGHGLADCLVKMRSLLLARQQSS